ncbi:MAG TPA: Hint domain-containing homing endonuclease [Polyangium sp.]|nr:Hint domain-containing homing endonuclease [Polyangium sp.]
MKTLSTHIIPICFFGLLALTGGCAGTTNDDEMVSSAAQAISANANYMRSLVRQNGNMGRIKVDLADNRQFQFLDARLRASGITPDTAPSLHAKLNAERERAIARRNGGTPNDPAPLAAEQNIVEANPSRCDAFVIPEQLDVQTFKTLTRGTCVAGADYTYVDTYHFDEEGNVEAYDFKEEWGNGIKVDLNMGSPTPAGKAVFADAITYQETTTTVESYYYVTNVYDNHLLTPSTTVTGTLTAPADVLPNGLIKYCLDRNQYLADCDYEHGSTGCNGTSICEANIAKFPVIPQPYNQDLLYMPMAGYSANVARINMVIHEVKAWLTLRNAGSTTPPGGFCSADLTNAGVVRLERQGTTSKVIIDPKAPSLGNASWPSHCSDNGRNVDLNIEVKLRGNTCSLGAACPGPTVRFTTLPTGNQTSTPPVQIWWGCLAEGTKIAMADGRKVAIQNVTVGDKVISDKDGRILTVVGITEGAERRPMVRVSDDHGHHVTMSASHALPIGDGKVIQAQEVQVGDLIETSDGMARVTHVERPQLDAGVYNLELGTDEQLAGLDPRSTTMYADGVLVGDSRMQGLVTEQRQSEANWAQDIAADKQFDYAQSMARMTGKAQK